jgi:ParB-like chromosome segregation protein Spo0J
MQPIVVDDDNNLVAGERRLVACKALGWGEIEVKSLGELTPRELCIIELEENIRRKDLTEYETSKVLVEYVEAVKETCSESEQVSNCQRRNKDSPVENLVLVVDKAVC